MSIQELWNSLETKVVASIPNFFFTTLIFFLISRICSFLADIFNSGIPGKDSIRLFKVPEIPAYMHVDEEEATMQAILIYLLECFEYSWHCMTC